MPSNRTIESTRNYWQKDKGGLSPELNLVPGDLHHIHLMGICGTGMSSLAGMLKQNGFQVTGSDQNIYPPISTLLEGLSIPVLSGYRPQNLKPKPDLVVVGNVITRNNPEALELSRLGLPYVSFAQAIRHFALKGKRSVVVSGTHGKTTVSAAIAWILERTGMDPGFMIGGIPRAFQKNFKMGKGTYFVIEGDEYDTAFFDKGPKFLHYNPWVTILTSIEFDHADIYRDLDHVVESFRKLIAFTPTEGLIIGNSDDPMVAQEIRGTRCPVITYGLSGEPGWKAVDISVGEDFTSFRVIAKGEEYASFLTPLYGNYNISNLLSVVVLADFLGIPKTIVHEALKDFTGVRRRQEIVGKERGILVLDDFAHHPSAVKETVTAVREKYRGRRLIAVFEPRSNSSRRNVFQDRYASSFDNADLVMIPEPPLMEKIPADKRFSSQRLVEDLRKKSLKAHYFPTTDRLLEALMTEVRSGDVVLFMSNGGFDNLPERLVGGLHEFPLTLSERQLNS
ncbi:MAG: UDP-N-acetylmuramate:L-alanyl-gamma-D-glutamyl-meso-diaminopimelate ligase [Pseudomonadota bacterium]